MLREIRTSTIYRLFCAKLFIEKFGVWLNGTIFFAASFIYSSSLAKNIALVGV